MSSRRQRRAQLRALECLAYASTLSYLRAQNDYDNQAKIVVEHLRPILHISSHRHLAELHRIINDEELQRLVSFRHFGEINLKQKWIELEEKNGHEENKTIATVSTRKKQKVSS